MQISTILDQIDLGAMMSFNRLCWTKVSASPPMPLACAYLPKWPEDVFRFFFATRKRPLPGN